MAKQKKNDKVLEHKEYQVLSINRSMVSDKLGDHVANQMTDEKMKSLASSLGDFCSGNTDTWEAALEGIVDFGDKSKATGP